MLNDDDWIDRFGGIVSPALRAAFLEAQQASRNPGTGGQMIMLVNIAAHLLAKVRELSSADRELVLGRLVRQMVDVVDENRGLTLLLLLRRLEPWGHEPLTPQAKSEFD